MLQSVYEQRTNLNFENNPYQEQENSFLPLKAVQQGLLGLVYQ